MEAKARWVEVQARGTTIEETSTENNAAEPVGNLYIEYGALKMTVDEFYPVESLSHLLREMCSIC